MKRVIAAALLVLLMAVIAVTVTAATRIEVVGERDYNSDLLRWQVSDAVGVSLSHAQFLIDAYGAERAEVLLKYKYPGTFRLFLWGHEYKVWTFGSCLYLVIYDPLTKEEFRGEASIALFEPSLEKPILSDSLPYVETGGYYMYQLEVSPGKYNVVITMSGGRKIQFAITIHDYL